MTISARPDGLECAGAQILSHHRRRGRSRHPKTVLRPTCGLPAHAPRSGRPLSCATPSALQPDEHVSPGKRLPHLGTRRSPADSIQNRSPAPLRAFCCASRHFRGRARAAGGSHCDRCPFSVLVSRPGGGQAYRAQSPHRPTQQLDTIPVHLIGRVHYQQYGRSHH